MTRLYILSQEEKKQLNLHLSHCVAKLPVIRAEWEYFILPINQLSNFIVPKLIDLLGINKKDIEIYKIDHHKGYGVSFNFNGKKYSSSVRIKKPKYFPTYSAQLLAFNDLYDGIINEANSALLNCS